MIATRPGTIVHLISYILLNKIHVHMHIYTSLYTHTHIVYITLGSKGYHPHFTDEETESQEVNKTF